MGQTDQALAEMQKALALNPRLSEAHYNIARLLIKKEPKKKNDGRGILPECLEIRRRARSGISETVAEINQALADIHSHPRSVSSSASMMLETIFVPCISLP